MTTDPILFARPYQVEAIDHLHKPGKGKALILDMGLGKTFICLQALTKAHLSSPGQQSATSGRHTCRLPL